MVCAAVWSGSVATLEAVVQALAAQRKAKGRAASPAACVREEKCCADCGPVFVEVRVCLCACVRHFRCLVACYFVLWT